MSPSTARKRPTDADIEALPPHLRGEILAGELVVRPRPAPPNVLVGSSLGGLLFGFDRDDERDGPGGWWVDDQPELHLDVDPDYPVVVPDLAGWRASNLPALPTTAAYTVRPDWVCEILSPSMGADDRALKMPFYAHAGVPHLWLIDPLLMTLEAYRLDAGRWTVLGVWGGTDRARVEPFEGTSSPRPVPTRGPLRDTRRSRPTTWRPSRWTENLPNCAGPWATWARSGPGGASPPRCGCGS